MYKETRASWVTRTPACNISDLSSSAKGGGGKESSLKSVHTELGKGFEKEAASERKHPSLSPKDRTRTTEIPKYLGNETQLKCGPLSGQMGGTGPEVRLPGGRRLWSKTLWV